MPANFHHASCDDNGNDDKVRANTNISAVSRMPKGVSVELRQFCVFIICFIFLLFCSAID